MPDFVLPVKNNASPLADPRGHHVAIRTPSLAEAKDFYGGKRFPGHRGMALSEQRKGNRAAIANSCTIHLDPGRSA